MIGLRVLKDGRFSWVLWRSSDLGGSLKRLFNNQFILSQVFS